MNTTLELSTITTIPKAFLQTSFTFFPILRKDKELRRLYCYVINQQFKHNKVVLSAKVLAHLEGKESQYKNKNYNGKAFLDRFEAYVMPIYYTNYDGKDYSYTKGKAREGIIKPHQILIDNWNFSIQGTRVYIDSLKDYSKDSTRAQARIRKEKKQLVDKVPAISQHQAGLLNYLNDLPSHRYKHMLKHIPEAQRITNELSNERSKTSTNIKLQNIQDCPKPFYSPSSKGRTHRIFGDSFLTLPKKVRSVLTQDWFELDLEQAQLRILASWWKCELVIDFLNSGKSLWKELQQYIKEVLPPGYKLNREQIDELKAINKKLIYSSCYGMGLRNLKSNYKEGFDEIFNSYNVKATKTIKGSVKCKDGSVRSTRKLSIGEYITAHPLISALLTERQKWIHKVKQDGGAQSPYGFIPLLKGMNPSAVLATIGQAYEQKLMEPIVALAKNDVKIDSRGYKTSRFQIMGYLHDGAFIHFQDKNAVSWYLNKLLFSWSQLSHDLGINISISLSFKSKKLVINPSTTNSISPDLIKDLITGSNPSFTSVSTKYSSIIPSSLSKPHKS